LAAAIGAAVPELMVLPLSETASGSAAEDALALLEQQHEACDAVVIGPGLDVESDPLVARFLAGSPLLTVVDAAALIAWGEAGRPRGAGRLVLTPHARELARLTGLEPRQVEVEADRATLAARLAREWDAVLVFKGAKTLIAPPETGSTLYLNVAGTPGLGTAGSGDVLAGVIGGLLARGARPSIAAVWGVHLHAIAGEVAAGRRGADGMIASDVVDGLPDALRALQARAGA
jgi:NAD(P)H-hydrate epimerase